MFERERNLDLGGVRVRLLMLGPGHTRGDTAIFVEDDRVLFSGDLAMKEKYPSWDQPVRVHGAVTTEYARMVR